MATALTKSAILLTSIAFSLAAFASQKHATAKADPPPAVQQPPVPLQPPSPEQMPAQPPEVRYKDGLLSIRADNSNLGDVLHAVHNAMGIGLDTPPGAGSERVVIHLGPGQPRDVLTQLFAGSRYDYILVGTPQNPNDVSQVILSARQNSSVASNAPPQAAPMQSMNSANADDESDNNNDDQPEPTAAPQLPQAGAPYQPNPSTQNSSQPNSGGGEAGPNRVKTPEQLLQELQRMQQQQQQNRRPDQ